MSQDLPIPRQDHRSDGTSIVAWGDDGSASGQVGRSLAGLWRDHRLPPVLAGLGAVAAVASLIGEWLVITVPNDGPDGSTTVRVPSGVADIGGFGIAYLIGLLCLAGAVALALRGTGEVRHNARVAGLGLAAAVLAVLTAAAVSLDDSGRRSFFYAPGIGFRIDYGRGLVAAFVAAVLLAAALYRSGQVSSEAPDREDDAGPAAPGDAAPEARPGRGRRRSADIELPAPADLTVQPTTPFAHPDLPH